VRAALDLLRSDVPVHGLAHITGGGLLNLTRLSETVGWRVDAPLAIPPVCELVGRLGDVPRAELWEVFNMGIGFACAVPAERADDAVMLLGRHHPGTARIGEVTDRAGVVEVEGLALS
jgi:phosphoribosylformylglycinamidine cyclo-ligase